MLKIQARIIRGGAKGHSHPGEIGAPSRGKNRRGEIGEEEVKGKVTEGGGRERPGEGGFLGGKWGRRGGWVGRGIGKSFGNLVNSFITSDVAVSSNPVEVGGG